MKGHSVNTYWRRSIVATPGMEDYLEQIYLHIERNGIARAIRHCRITRCASFISDENGSAIRSEKDMSIMNDTKGLN